MTPALRLRLRRRAGAAATLAALAAALLVLAPGSPAGADPVITVATPAEGSTVDTATVAVSGRVQAGSVLASFKDVTLKVAGVSFKAPCSSSPCDFTWNPSLTSNGRYSLTVTATEQTLVLDGASASLTRAFVVDAPPARPALDPPKVNDARTVDLTWSRNTEPDMLYYAVFRKDPAGATYLPVGRVDQPASGKSVAFTDSTTNLNGGDYGYQVVAVRKGGAKPETTSAPSIARTATVPAPPTTTTAVTVPGAPGPGQGSTTTVKPGAAAGVDLSGFLSARSQAAPAPPPTVLVPPDPGFQGTLPFGAAAPSDQVEPGNAQAVPPSTGRPTSIVSLDGARPLVPVAAGLVLLLLATHLRLLNRRLKPATARDLPIEAASPPPPPAPRVVDIADPAVPDRAAPGPYAAPGPSTTFYDVSDDEDWEDRAPAGPGETERASATEPAMGVDENAGAEFDRWWAAEEDRQPDIEAQPAWEPELEPELAFDPIAYEPEPTLDPDVEPELAFPTGTAFEPWSEPDPEFELEPVGSTIVAARPDEPDVDLDELEEHFEVLEVISPTRRALARSGHR